MLCGKLRAQKYNKPMLTTNDKANRNKLVIDIQRRISYMH